MTKKQLIEKIAALERRLADMEARNIQSLGALTAVHHHHHYPPAPLQPASPYNPFAQPGTTTPQYGTIIGTGVSGTIISTSGSGMPATSVFTGGHCHIAHSKS